MSFYAFLISMVSCAPILFPVLLTSINTPPSLLSQFPQTYPAVSIELQNFPEVVAELLRIDFNILIDITLQKSLYPVLDQIASYFNSVYLSISPPSDHSFSSWRVNVHNSYTSEASAVAILLEYLQWSQIALISSSTHENLLISAEIYDVFHDTIESYLKYSPIMTQATSDEFIGKMVKAKGIRHMVIVDQGDSLMKIQQSLTNKKLLKAGAGIVLSSKAIFSEKNLEFSLIIVETGLEYSESPESYELLAINNTLSQILQTVYSLGLSSIERSSLTELIMDLYPDHTSVKSYSIVNIQNAQSTIVGSITDSVIITQEIYFPGNTTVSLASEATAIRLSLANGTHEIYDLYTIEIMSYFYEGASYAVMRSNAYNEIPNFKFELFPTDCGIYFYDPTFYELYYSPIKADLGVAYLTNFWYTTSYGVLVTLRDLGIDLPQISAFAAADLLDNSTAFPEFLKLSVSVSQYLTTGFLFLKSIGWNEVVLLATDDPTFYVEYLDLLEFAGPMGITVVNPPDKRVFPANYTRDNFEEYRSYFQAAKDTRARVYLIAAIDRGVIWEGLYDIGLRRGDFITIGESAQLGYLKDPAVAPQYMAKREELMLDTFVLAYKEFVGDLGESLQAELSQIFPDLSYMCMTYDTVSVVKEAIIYILSKGDDYEDPEVLKTVMRNNRLVGCLGNIFFQTGANSRSTSKFSIQQVKLMQGAGIWYPDEVAVVDKLSTQIITYVKELEWPTDNATIPTNLRPVNPCPFDTFQIVEAVGGKEVLYALSVVFFIIACLSAGFTHRYSRRDYKPLHEKQIITFADMVFLAYFAFQFFQIIAEGPDQDAYKYVVQNFQLLVSLDFTLYFKLQFTIFWNFFYGVMLFAVVWIILCAVVILKCQVIFENNFFCGKIRFLTELILPILGHIGFLPVFSMMMNIFSCNDAIGSSLTDTFLDSDCTVFCYTGMHRLYAILTAICIVLYISLAIYCRHIWESTQFSLNLGTRPLYLSFLSIFQVVIVILNKSLKIFDQSVHGYTVSAIIIGFIAVTVVMKPYNYMRCNVLQVSSLVLALWGVLASSIFRSVNNMTAWIISEFVGFVVIIVVGGVIMVKHPSMLYSKKGKDISTLFLFQFCKEYEKYIRDPKSIELAERQGMYKAES